MRVRISYLQWSSLWSLFYIIIVLRSVLGCHECYACPGGSQPQDGISVTTCEACLVGKNNTHIINRASSPGGPGPFPAFQYVVYATLKCWEWAWGDSFIGSLLLKPFPAFQSCILSYYWNTGTYPLTTIGYTHYLLLQSENLSFIFQASIENWATVYSVKNAHMVNTKKKMAKRSAMCAPKISTAPTQRRKWNVLMVPSVHREALFPSSAKICSSMTVWNRYSCHYEAKIEAYRLIIY